MCLKPGDILHDRYQIIEELGRGGFATTYKARDLDIPDELICVVKEIQPPRSKDPSVLQIARERCDREVRALLSLGEHDRIPRFFARFQSTFRVSYRHKHFFQNFANKLSYFLSDRWLNLFRVRSQEHNNFYLILEYIEGHPLNEEITQSPLWTQQKVIDFLQDILPVIEFVHQNNVIHRDIKPSNLIRRSSDNRIVLIDFGAVKEISTLDNPELESNRTVNIGTCGYMAAEQSHGCPRFGSDIYSIGIICIQALTGLPPTNFKKDDRNDIIWRSHCGSISKPLIAILNRMVRYNFLERYQSVTDILHNLKSIDPLDLPQQSEENGSMLLPAPLQNRLSRPKFRWLMLGTIGILTGCTIAIVYDKILAPQTCSSVQGDSLSCGEESLLKTSTPRLKQGGVNAFARSNYREAFKLLKRSWNEEERKDPETLIYMNNALLKAQEVDYYTIAVTIPVQTNERGRVEIDLAKEILRGVAQAQTEFNLKLFNSQLDRNLNGLEFQENRQIKGKGLQVIIADDANQKTEAIARANSLVKLGGVLGTIGHYTNEMTVPTVDIYDRARLVLISPGSTTEELTDKPRKFFFRTVPRTHVTVELFTKYLMEKQGQTTVAGFYNTNSEATSSLWEEFRKQFRQRGGNIARITEFDLAQSDFNVKKALQEIGKTDKTTIVLSPGHHEKAFNNAMALFQANSDKNWFVGTGGIYGQKTLETAAKLPSFEKLLVAISWHYLSSPDRKFVENALQLWEGNVSHRTALTYDAAKTLIQAIETQSQPTREGIQETIANPNFSASGATGTIQFEPTGDRKNFQPKLVHIVKCNKEQFGVTFVPIEFPTAAAAGLKCE